jgi:hypothetical protein
MNQSVRAVCLLLAVLPLAARAQTSPAPQFSLSLLSSTLAGACDPSSHCEARRLGGRLRVGAPLPTELALDLGPLRVDTVELAYTAHGTARATQQVRKRVFTGAAAGVLKTVTEETTVSATALSMGLAAHAALTADWQATTRLGLAAVATTVRRAEDGGSLGGSTENHLAPTWGLGLGWAPLSTVTLTLDWERTRYASDGKKGQLQAWGIGVQWAP